MTESACGSSTRRAPARCGLASILATMRHREPSRLDVDHPSVRQERTLNSTAVQYPAMVRQPAGVVHMLGKQSTSVSDAHSGFRASWRPARFTSWAGDSAPVIRSRWPATRRTYSDGVTAGRALLAQLDLLLRATDRGSAVAHYHAFKWEVVPRLPQADCVWPPQGDTTHAAASRQAIRIVPPFPSSRPYTCFPNAQTL